MLVNEIVFEVTQESDGGFVAECLTEGIFTQADDWDGLRRNVKEAVAAFYFDDPRPPTAIRLHLPKRNTPPVVWDQRLGSAGKFGL